MIIALVVLYIIVSVFFGSLALIAMGCGLSPGLALLYTLGWPVVVPVHFVVALLTRKR